MEVEISDPEWYVDMFISDDVGKKKPKDRNWGNKYNNNKIFKKYWYLFYKTGTLILVL